jgi:hypothetical protein
MAALTAKLRGLIGFYYTGGAQSLGKMTQLQVRLLRTFKPQTLPFDYNAGQLRSAARENIQFVMTQDTLSVPVTLALKDATDALQEWFLKTPAYASVDADVQNLISIQLGAMIGATTLGFVPYTLALTKASIISEMARAPGAPFYKNDVGDYEKDILEILSTQTTEKTAQGTQRHLGLRQTATKVLVTYSDLPEVKALMETQKAGLLEEIKNAKSAESRESLRAILKILEAPQKDSQGSSSDNKDD